MTKYPDSLNDKTDDLDLLALSLKAVFFIKKYGKLIIATSFVGLFCGVIIYKALPKSYSAKLVLESTVLTNGEEIQLITDWDDLLNRDGYPILAKNFNCNPLILTKLQSIKAEQILRTGGPEGPSGFFIDIVVKDTSLLDELQNGIVYGLENNEYVREKVAAKKANLEELIRNVNKELVKLDSLKSTIEEIIQNKKKNSSSLMVDVSGTSNQMILLQEKLLTYQEQLQFVNAVHVLQDFVKSGRPKQPKLLVLVAAGLAFGFFCGCCLVFYRVLRRRYHSAVKNAGQTEA